MSNLLSLPFKKTYPINVKDPVRQYIQAHGGAHPDKFKQDIKLWHELREAGVGGIVHISKIKSTLLYHAQLVSLSAKLPADIGLDIVYATVFKPETVPVTLSNLGFERVSVLFNLAALYSQLASSEDRSALEGIKRAASHYQSAAGTFSFLLSSTLGKFTYSPDNADSLLDLSEPFLKALEWLMLAQAQECSWQIAKLNQYKNSLIAKIAARTATLYQLTVSTIIEATPTVKHLFPSDWLPHIEAKAHHFVAVAEFRKSMDEVESSSKYGFEIARLSAARVEAKKAYDIARRGKISPSVLKDVQSLLEIVEKSLIRAERDNDLIYHQDVPAASTIEQVQQTNLVSATVPPGLLNPGGMIGSRLAILSGLVSWGAREAINIYNDRKQNLLEDRVVDVAQILQYNADEKLRKFNLPSALEVLERPIGLPPSLLRKAEEVRLEDGPAKIAASIEDVQRLAQQDTSILDEAMDILDSEASEDEATRQEIPLNRLPSHEANTELIQKATRYRTILQEAATSDESVRQKWDEWEESISELIKDEEELEASIPSSTIESSSAPSPESKQTRIHARALRVKLEELDSLSRDRDQLVNRARRLAEADDIQPRILKAAGGFERLTDVQPAMFEDVLDDELAKYDWILRDLADFEQKQIAILSDIESLNEKYIASRRDDPSVKARERALQSLDLAFFKYKEITQNLDEGFKFYNDLAGILTQFKEYCKSWSYHRNQEIGVLTRSMKNVTIRDNGERKGSYTANSLPSTPTPKAQPSPTRKTPAKSAFTLPAIDSNEWEYEEIPLPPGPRSRK